MVLTTDETVMSSRYLNLKKSFQLGVRSILTAFSKEDVHKAFPTFTEAERESLYRMFVQIIKSLHANIEEEFESICQEAQVGNILGVVEQLVEEQNLDILSTEKNTIADAKEKISRAKQDEIQHLTGLLEKAEAENNIKRARIELLKEKQQNLSATADAVEKLRSWNSKYARYDSN